MKRLAITGICLIGICTLAATSAIAQKARKPGPQSKPEAAAVTAMLQAQTPDDQIRTADELITKFSNTDFKSFALATEADAYEGKGNHEKAIVYCEQALAADPKNFDAEILMANVIAASTKDTDLDKADKLANAAKFAKEALDTIPTVPKPVLFQMTDDAWTTQKNAASARAWQAMGLVATVQKKPDEAIDAYEKGLALVPDPILMVRVARALEAQKKYDDAITWLDKAAASPTASAQIKDISAKDKVRITNEKPKA